MNNLTILESKSPHLDATLRRFLTENEVKQCRAIFEISYLNGGAKELDFERDPETSYNPRVARIPLILIKEAKSFNAESVKAAILYSAHDSLLDEYRHSDLFGELVKNIHAQSKLPIEKLRSLKQEHAMSIEVALSGQLDRIRHLHQAKDNQKTLLAESILKESNDWIELAKQNNSQLFPIICHWYTNTAPRILTKL